MEVLRVRMSGLLAAILCGVASASADNGRMVLSLVGTNTLVQVRGDATEDWRLQSSTNLTRWVTVTNFGTLLSGGTNAPWRSVGGHGGVGIQYRGLRTGGFYDTSLLRIISLTFTQANFSNQLVSARTYETNVYCSMLTVNNGATNIGVGARFRGNTSFTGMGGTPPPKKSFAIQIDYSVTNAELMGFDNLNLNNAYTDYTIERETLYFNLMRTYTICPRCCLARLYVNNADWGVYSCAQQEDGHLIKEYCPSSDGDRWRAPNAAPGGGFSGSGSALSWLGSNVTSYTSNYALKSSYTNNLGYTNAWLRLIKACYVLNNTPNDFRNKVEEVLAVDSWLWFLAIENLFADEDSYWYKGADYSFYYEPESGRIHPVEHDGNESSLSSEYTLSPIYGYNLANRPVLKQLLSNNELRQRYLAHMRTVMAEAFNPTNLTPVINSNSSLSVAAIVADPKKGFTMTQYTNALVTLKQFATNRYNYLKSSSYLTPLPPNILGVYPPASGTNAGQVPFVTAQVSANGANGINSVWLYHRGAGYGRFTCARMLDDGAHGDGAAGDGVFGAATTNYPGGTKVRYYVEARSANSALAASFAPARAERETYSYKVALTTATNTPVVINELMADNQTTMVDPQGQYDDWIELRNLTEEPLDISGLFLSDEPNNPHKWQFPPATTIPASGYLIVWADEDGTATPGLHASFKLSKSGEEVYLSTTNSVLDHVVFGPQQTDKSYGRTAANDDLWEVMEPTPEAANE